MPNAENTTAPTGLWARFNAMPLDSAPRTITVAVVLCLICSMIVSGAAVMLKPQQEINKTLDKKTNILKVAGLYQDGIDVEKAFGAFEPRLVDVATGKFSDAEDAATYDQRVAAKDPARSIALANDPASIKRQAKLASVYLLRDDAGKIERIVLPVHGYGLWSTLYGFIALNADGNEVYGLRFYAHGETPGLGAEVDNPKWMAQWPGKLVYGDNGAVNIGVGKAAPAGIDGSKHHIDAIAGATLTSRGVDNLVKFWMGEQGFKTFLDNLKKGEA
ncbi:Na+-transporting NADH:ubiquinone oxidoreductase subunit C [Pseudovibrio denitrificans]|uniref:Na(+)-translocating NADH-quinone reductase subunit C n=1 Tax=Pseudovibrio denitrificans TaxID=258256 RepID=A0A1I7DXF9_9HYPH|nr:Na(+)-translocating NADH-quinone reductase subunit C [Pseudovibrio denitrificans]SFU16315.1 Na+-transporting NADH:ubiquinone oxidoreductase subunit C [Pseudovibrio denitrificans]